MGSKTHDCDEDTTWTDTERVSQGTVTYRYWKCSVCGADSGMAQKVGETVDDA